MTSIHPTQVLMNEHRVIERVLTAMETKVQELGSGPFPRRFFDQALDFFANFADRCHHGKEEQRLFPLLKERGIPEEGGPIGVMLHEHDEGRAYLGALRDNLDDAERGEPEAVAVVRAAATDYIELLRHHIQKEDNILFAMARRVLSPEDVERLQKEFQCVEEHHIGPGVHAHYEALAAELSGTGVAHPCCAPSLQ